ncbi:MULTISPECIES: PAS domain-containing sensor histidine kinase [Metabacillus]|uniref:PAS domain-containing sensor histidine kinase n=1 Tax=Metabacillus TaxID=2675233 RepID=UPI0004937D11|nr:MULTISPECIES: PAS domain-containing sensor histidine kinase [Metabacillus]KEZ52665.1 sporulation kinase [Metabacillus indicus LMG 22858]
MSKVMNECEVTSLQEQITILKEENKRLAEESRQQELIIESAMEAIIILDESFHFIDCNKSACHLFQLDKQEMSKRKMCDFLSLVPHQQLLNQVDELRDRDQIEDELIIKLDNGQVKFIELSIKKNALGTRHLALMRDISSNKMLERERTINEQLFKDLFHRAVDGIVIFDGSGQFIDANGSFCLNFEIDKNSLGSFKLEDFVEHQNQFKLDKLWSILNEGGRAKGEMPVTLLSGRRKVFEFTSTSNVLSGFNMAIMRDITEKRNMEMKLFKSEERFREIFENAIDAIIIWNNDGRIISANQSACRTFELSMENLISSSIFDFMDLSESKFRTVKKEYVKSGAIREELLFYMPNGQCKQLEFTSKMDVTDGHHLTILRNVSDRKQMEKELRESEQKFRKIFNGAMDGIVLIDDNYTIIDANQAAGKILEIPLEDIHKYNLHELISYDKMEGSAMYLMDEMTEEIPFKLQNNKEKILEFSLKRHIIENMNLAIFRDVTEKKELEERLRKSDTLSVVGELAAGIAHEIRNPMTALKGFIQLLEANVKEDFSMYFNVITSELSRIESIITEFLILAKPQAISYQEKDVVTIMKETIDLLNAQAILVNVQIELFHNGCVPHVYCEPNQLKQVFINILKNAIEVMPSGGTIQVNISLKNEDELHISIIDEGSGIPEDKIKRLGEPFYTTKDRGTGLGLMVSYKIIEEHCGKVEVESEVGKGTAFHISLPLHQTSC